MARKYSRYAAKLLPFFALHRLALADHVRRQFAHFFGTDRTARMHLQTLAENGDLEILRRPVTGRQNIYALTSRGYAQNGESSRRPASPVTKRRGIGNHLVHELLVTEIATRFHERMAQRSDMDLVWEERFGLAEHVAFRSLLPDYLFMVRHQRGFLLNLVEISSGEESSARIREKFLNYADWMHSSDAINFVVDLYRRHGATRPRMSYRLLLVVEDRRRANDERLLGQFMRQLEHVPADFHTCVWGAPISRIRGSNAAIDGRVWTSVFSNRANMPHLYPRISLGTKEIH